MVVSFSTHGLENAQGQYIILHDGLYSQPTEGSITVAELNDLMGRANASKRLLLVDACRVTPEATAKAPPQRMTDQFLQRLQEAKGWEFMTACNKGEASYEDATKGHGIFTYWLLMGLKGGAGASEGLITVGTIESFLTEKVPRYSTLHAQMQNPQFTQRATEGNAKDIPLAVPE